MSHLSVRNIRNVSRQFPCLLAFLEDGGTRINGSPRIETPRTMKAEIRKDHRQPNLATVASFRYDHMRLLQVVCT